MATEAQYNAVWIAYQNLLDRSTIQTGNSNGCHYHLVYALMQAGVSCRGLTNQEIEGEAARYLEVHACRVH